jgi:hypothetical protein
VEHAQFAAVGIGFAVQQRKTRASCRVVPGGRRQVGEAKAGLSLSVVAGDHFDFSK